MRKRTVAAHGFCREPNDCAHEPLTTAEIFELSYPVKPMPPLPESPYLDGHNDAVTDIQSYLNGRTVGAWCWEEKRYLLRLRLDLNWMLISPEPAGAA